MRLLIISVVLAVAAGTAHAYPQYQLSHEQTCAACHISPVGGGLLDDNGELTAEDESQWGGNPGFLHGALELPEWLRLGGDLRGAAGVHSAGGGSEGGFAPAIFPMQTELYAYAAKDAFSAYAVGGVTLKDSGAVNSATHSVAPFSREHWLMWQQGDGEGAYVRVGRFMPVYGLRPPEHIYYTRKFGGTPLFSEVYGLNAGWLKPDLEVHATAFIHDPLVDGAIEEGDGAAIYVEKRLGGTKSIGILDRFTTSDTDTRLQGGLTGKLWMDSKKLLVATEVQAIRQDFKMTRGPTRVQIVGNVMATYFAKPGLFIDVALGLFDEDTALAKDEREAFDVNVHFFALSHLELILMNRYQLIGFGSGGDSSGYSMLQLHYRI